MVERSPIEPDKEMMEVFLSALTDTYTACYSGYQQSAARQIRVGGKPALQLSSRYVVGDKVYQNLETFVFAGERRFRIITCTSFPDTVGKNPAGFSEKTLKRYPSANV